MSYATDGLCHNAQPGTYGHECARPAEWIGTSRTGFACGFCDACKREGYEAQGMVSWQPLEVRAADPAQRLHPGRQAAEWHAEQETAKLWGEPYAWRAVAVRGGWNLELFSTD